MAIRKPQKAVEKTGARYDELLAALNRQDSVPSPGTIVKGKVTGKRGNEILVDIGCKSAGAIPANEFENPDAVSVGDSYDVLLIDLEGENGMVVVSKRQADEKIRWEAILAKYKEGDTVQGVIRSKVRGGMIVAVDGVDAFLPGSQVDVNPSRDLDIYITGEPQDFKIIKISDERRNIIVSRRELLEAQMAEKKHALLQTLAKGQIVHGKVKNITDFGAFVDLDGMDGLLHITDMSWGRIKHPSELLKVGQELDVMILDVDLDRERVSLGLKQAQANPWDDITSRYPVGSRLHGKVVNLAPYGAFVEIEPGIEGLVHVSEFSWTKRIARASDVLSVGDEVDVVVLNIDAANQKIALGIRQTEANPWDTVQDRYPVGSRITGKVRNFTTYGAFVEMEEGIDGMIHVSDMSCLRDPPEGPDRRGHRPRDRRRQPAHLPRPQAGADRPLELHRLHLPDRPDRQGQGLQDRLLRRLRRARGRCRRPRPHLPDLRPAHRQGSRRAQGRPGGRGPHRQDRPRGAPHRPLHQGRQHGRGRGRPPHRRGRGRKPRPHRPPRFLRQRLRGSLRRLRGMAPRPGLSQAKPLKKAPNPTVRGFFCARPQPPPRPMRESIDIPRMGGGRGRLGGSAARPSWLGG